MMHNQTLDNSIRIRDRLSIVATAAGLLAYLATLAIAYLNRDREALQIHLALLILVVFIGGWFAWSAWQKGPEPSRLKKATGENKFHGVQIWTTRGEGYVTRPEGKTLTDMITTHDVTILTGESGQGKSSLLRVELPDISGPHSSPFQTVHINSYTTPVSQRILKQVGDPHGEDVQATLLVCADGLPEGRQLVVTFDHFEQVLTRSSSAHAQQNLDTIGRLLRCAPRVHFVIAIRKEWYLDLVDFLEQCKPRPSYTHLTLSSFATEQDKSSIKNIALAAGFKESLREEWLRDLDIGHGIVPVEMQITGQVIESNLSIIEADYNRYRKEGLVDAYFRILVKTSKHQEGTRLVLLALSQERNMRRFMSLEQLRLLVQMDPQIIREVVDELVQGGVVVTEGGYFSLAHDYLAIKYQEYVTKHGDGTVREILRTMATTWGLVRAFDEASLKEVKTLTVDHWKRREGRYVAAYLLGIALLATRLFLPLLPGGTVVTRAIGLHLPPGAVGDASFFPTFLAGVFVPWYFLAFYLKFIEPAQRFWRDTEFITSSQIAWQQPLLVFATALIVCWIQPVFWPIFIGVGSFMIALSLFSLAWTPGVTPLFKNYFEKSGGNALAIAFIAAIAGIPLWVVHSTDVSSQGLLFSPGAINALYAVMASIGALMLIQQRLTYDLGMLVGMINLEYLWLIAPRFRRSTLLQTSEERRPELTAAPRLA